MLEKPVGWPDPLQAENCFSIFSRLEPAVSQFQGQALKSNQLDEVAHMRVFLLDELHRSLVLVILQKRVKFKNDSPRAVLRDHPFFDGVVIRGGLFVFLVEKPGRTDQDFCLGDLHGGGVLLHVGRISVGTCREKGKELFQCGAGFLVVLVLRVGDTQPELKLLDFRGLERRLLLEGDLDRLDRVAKFFHVNVAHGMAVADVADRLRRFLRLAVVSDQLFVEIRRFGIFSVHIKPLGVRIVFLRGQPLRLQSALCHASCCEEDHDHKGQAGEEREGTFHRDHQ